MLDTSWLFALIAGSGYIITAIVLFFSRQLVLSKDQVIAANEKSFGLTMIVKDAELIEQKSMKISYKDIAEEAVKSNVQTTNYYRNKYENLPPLVILGAVIPESHSPSTALQREQAGIATMRATMAQIKTSMGQEPRPEPPHAIEEESNE